MERYKRLESIIYRNVTEIIQFSLTNPRVGFVTINEVILAKDLSKARIYVTFLGTNTPKNNLHELNKCKGFIRHELAQKMATRKIPELEFILDETNEKSARIDELLILEEEQLSQMKKNK